MVPHFLLLFEVYQRWELSFNRKEIVLNRNDLLKWIIDWRNIKEIRLTRPIIPIVFHGNLIFVLHEGDKKKVKTFWFNRNEFIKGYDEMRELAKHKKIDVNFIMSFPFVPSGIKIKK